MTETQASAVEIHCLPVGPMESNCFLAIDRESREALLVDPGADGERILEWVKEHDAEVNYILNTHGHGDHIGANGFAKERFKAPIGIHKEDAPCLTDPALNLSAYFQPVVSPPADFYLEPDSTIDWNGPTVEVLHTPGHSPGSVSFHGDGWIISGDLIFQGSIGRTDFPRCDFHALQNSIRSQLMTLPPDTVIYPGHGPSTTVGHERENNPFLHLG